jgi:hypothetical protein
MPQNNEGQRRNPRLYWWPAVAGPLLFFLQGAAFLSYPGLQNDEALAAAPLYRISDSCAHWDIVHRQIPVMLLPYLGALKTWLYVPWFKILRPSSISIRLPGLLLAAATTGLLFLLVAKIHSRRTAWIAMLLLATDTTYLLTSCFDWGPVVLQHFLSIAGILLIVYFYQHSSIPAVAAAGFFFGLAFWDKALFAWLGVGLATATLIIFPRELFRSMQLRYIVAAAAAFCLGAAPLIVYNVTNVYPTFHSTSGFTLTEIYPKSFVLRSTWEGAALLGYLVREDTAPNPRQPSNTLERASFGLRNIAGEHRRNLLDWGLLAALASFPFLWRTRAMRVYLFCLVAIAVGWLQMAITRGAGAAAHHVVLLWPLPHILLAIAFAQVAERTGRFGRALVAAFVAFLVAGNVVLTDQYYYQYVRNGAAGSWTDAIHGLSQELPKLPAKYVAVIDWGIIIPLDVLNRGRLPLFWAGDPFIPRRAPEIPPAVDARLLDEQVLWVSYTAGNEQFTGVNAGLDSYAARTGYQKVSVQTFYDRNGRSIFDAFRLRKVAGPSH